MATPETKTVIIEQTRDDQDEESSFNNTTTTTSGSSRRRQPAVSNKKKVVTKKLNQKSFDDDWDSFPDQVTDDFSKKVNTSTPNYNESPEMKPKYSSKFAMESPTMTTSSPVDSNDYARVNFSSAKSISSKQYFGDDQDQQDPEKNARLSKFSGATSISSAQYYDRDETPTIYDMRASDLAKQFVYTAKTDFKNISTIVMDSSKKLSTMATNALSDLQDRYR
eukprot:gene8922-10454_t